MSSSTGDLRGDDVAPPPRPTSTRMSGLRGQVLSRQTNNRGSSSRPVSGRVSGLRGQLQSGRGSDINPLTSTSESFLSNIEVNPLLPSSASNPCLLTEASHNLNEYNPVHQSPTSANQEPPEDPRLKTAVLAKGRRRLPLGENSADTCLLPSTGSHGNDAESSIAPPISCEGEPVVRLLQDTQDTTNRQSMNECLASITEFDQSHLGQIGTDLQGVWVCMSCE